MTISEALTTAVSHHEAGRLAAAEQIYRRILQVEPNHADALHLLGVLAHQVGQHELALEYMSRAIGLNGIAPEMHNNLGNVYQALRKSPESVACYRRALALQPDYAEAHHNLGNALKEEGKLGEAIACYGRALELKPQYTEAHGGLGAALMHQAKPEQATASFRRALELHPDDAQLWSNLGVAFVEQGKPDEAIPALRRALELDPSCAEIHNNLGNAFKAQRKPAESVACFRRALELKPSYAGALNNLGNALRELGQVDEAATCFRRALELKPDLAVAHNSLAGALKEQGHLQEAIACCRRALEHQPGYPEAHCNLGLFLLQLGEYAEGWREYEHRFERLATPSRFSKPRWNGERAEGQTILIHSEQGLGDTLQFMRYASLVRQRSGAQRVILEAQPSLARLLRHHSGSEVEIVAGFHSEESVLPPFDYHIPLLSLPLALRIFEPLPPHGSYLQADPQLRPAWRKRLGDAEKVRVGLAWAGSPTHIDDRLRSMPPEKFLPFVQIPGLEFYNLQIASTAAQPLSEAGLIDLTEHITDFADTAALIAELDLIITVDTAVAHLAGAMGRPVWTLLAFPSDWRWGMAGERTPWYPTMRLFRQPTPGDWASVVEQVRAELEHSVSRS